jgi:spore coat protein W
LSDSSKPHPINDKVIEIMVQSVFRKNGIEPNEVKKNIPEEQKQMLREMVEELKKQVEDFQEKQKKDD